MLSWRDDGSAVVSTSNSNVKCGKWIICTALEWTGWEQIKLYDYLSSAPQRTRKRVHQRVPQLQ